MRAEEWCCGKQYTVTELNESRSVVFVVILKNKTKINESRRVVLWKQYTVTELNESRSVVFVVTLKNKITKINEADEWCRGNSKDITK